MMGGRQREQFFLLLGLPASSQPARGYVVCRSSCGLCEAGLDPCPKALPLPCLCWSLIMGVRVSGQGCGRTRSSASYEHLSESVCPGAGDVAFRGVERHVVDGLLKLLPVSRELLDAGFTLQVPETDGAVVTCGGERVRRST